MGCREALVARALVRAALTLVSSLQISLRLGISRLGISQKRKLTKPR